MPGRPGKTVFPGRQAFLASLSGIFPWHFVTMPIHVARNSDNLTKTEEMVFQNAHSRFGLRDHSKPDPAWCARIHRTDPSTDESDRIRIPESIMLFMQGQTHYAVLMGGSNGDGALRGMVTLFELIDPRPYQNQSPVHGRLIYTAFYMSDRLFTQENPNPHLTPPSQAA